jgi:predicted Na+-dependent transporter
LQDYQIFSFCQKRTINTDQQPLLVNKQETLIERWRFSREDTIAIMFCAATKTVAKGVPLITAVNSKNNQDLIGLFSLPLILYHVEQLILGANRGDFITALAQI